MLVIDTSALLAVFFDEPSALWVTQVLESHDGELLMSSVNLTETLIRLKDRQPGRFPDLEATLFHSSIKFVPPDVEQARLAAAARLKYPLNLGDCFAYALAQTRGCPILTLDSDFKNTDCEILAP